MRLALAGWALAACYTGPSSSTTPVLANASSEQRTGVLTITTAGFGAIGPDTPATLLPLRRALVGFEVKPVNDGSLAYDILRNGERLAYVVPNDEDATIFNIHAVSSQVVVAGRDWRVGERFRDAKRITHCECWGEQPTCFKTGDHVAVNFARACGDLESGDRAVFRELDGLVIERVIWSPRPFGGSPPADADDMHDYP